MDPDSGFSVMPICELVDEYGKENVQALFSTYRAVYDSDTESFLRDKAIEMDERDLSRTYVAVRDNDMKVLGFVSLSIKCITIPEENCASLIPLFTASVCPLSFSLLQMILSP